MVLRPHLRPHMVGIVVRVPCLVSHGDAAQGKAVGPLATPANGPQSSIAWFKTPNSQPLPVSSIANGDDDNGNSSSNSRSRLKQQQQQ